MSYWTMQKNLVGDIPNIAQAKAASVINEALGNIYDETDWSFQTGWGGWNCPGLVASSGTFTCTPYSPTVIADAGATAALANYAPAGGRPLLTELQFRNPAYSLYNIIKYDTVTNAPFATLTLDRPWLEPTSGAGQPYMIYQAYFPAPVQDFRKFVEIRDTTNNQPVSYTGCNREDLSSLDPQRLIFGPAFPTYAVSAGVDQRPNSSTLGWVMYELWPHVLSHIPYSFSYRRRGSLLVNSSDTVVYPLTEDLVKWRAKEILYQFKEAQKGEQVMRGSGANWQFLAQNAHAEYLKCLRDVRAADANLHQDFVTRPRPTSLGVSNDGFSTNRTGQLNVGSWRR